MNPGLTIHFTDNRIEPAAEATYHEPDGIKAYVKDLNTGKEPVQDIVYYKRAKTALKWKLHSSMSMNLKKIF